MDSTAVTRERRTFVRGVIALIVLGVAVFTPVAYHFPSWASPLFAMEMLLIVTWFLRHQRLSKALQAPERDPERS